MAEKTFHHDYIEWAVRSFDQGDKWEARVYEVGSDAPTKGLRIPKNEKNEEEALIRTIEWFKETYNQ